MDRQTYSQTERLQIVAESGLEGWVTRHVASNNATLLAPVNGGATLTPGVDAGVPPMPATTRSEKLAEKANAISNQIMSRQAVTCYMHRSHDIDGFSDAMGDVDPRWVRGKWYGSIFGTPSDVHITTKRDDRVRLGDVLPRYYVDCAGFVRELISQIARDEPGGVDPKAPLLARAAGDAIDGFARRAYPRANVFAEFFRNLPSEQQTPGQPWMRVEHKVGQLRRGDVTRGQEGIQCQKSHWPHLDCCV